MRQEERLSLILERLSQTGSVGVSGVAAELGVSTASVRRDLQLLEEQHLLSRTHGQTASPTTVGKEIANVVVRLTAARDSKP